MTTIAGGASANADGIGLSAGFGNPSDVAVDDRCGCIIVADTNNQRIRIVTPLAGINTCQRVGVGTCSEASFFGQKLCAG